MDVIHHESYDLGKNVGWNECLEAIQLNREDNWIPCSERLPEVLERIEDDCCPEFNMTIKEAEKSIKGNGELIMTKGYILVDVPKTCLDCRFCSEVHEGIEACCELEDNPEDNELMRDIDVSYTQGKPEWCPIQTWISVTEKKPSNKDEVYVTLRDGSRDICWYVKEFDEWYDSQYNKKDVVKWLPFDIEQFKEK